LAWSSVADAATAYSCTATGNWSANTCWNPGSGYPGQVTGDSITAIGNTFNVTLDGTAASTLASHTLASLTIGASSNGYIVSALAGTASTITFTGNPGITCAGTAASGVFQVTQGTLTINTSGSPATLASDTAASGSLVTTSGTASAIVSNSGNTVLKCTGAGVGFTGGGSGNLQVTGSVATTGGNGILWGSSGTASQFNGNVYASGTGYLKTTGGTVTWVPSAGTPCTEAGTVSPMQVVGGTLFISGSWAYGAAGNTVQPPVLLSSGTCQWIGTAAIASTSSCWIGAEAGYLYLGTASNPLTLTNSGTIGIINTGATFNSNGTFTNSTSAAQFALVGSSLQMTDYALAPSGSDIWTGVTVTTPTGSVTGTMTVAASDVWTGASIHGSTTGTMTLATSDVWTGIAVHAASNTGTLSVATSDVWTGMAIHGTTTGTLSIAPSDAWTGVTLHGSTTGSMSVAASDVWSGASIHGSTTGSLTQSPSDTWTGIVMHGSTTGSLSVAASNVAWGQTVHGGSVTGTYAGHGPLSAPKPLEKTDKDDQAVPDYRRWRIIIEEDRK